MEAQEQATSELFRVIDTDNSSDISREEMIAGAIELKMTEEEAAKLFDTLDTNHDGVVSKSASGFNFDCGVAVISFPVH